METFELKYFLGVAQLENIHRASEKLHISPASLSKAILRLEEELCVKLFRRQGRNIRLTDSGRVLQERAAQILRLEEAARVEVAGPLGNFQVVLAGPEILLSRMGVTFCQRLKKAYPLVRFDLHAVSSEKAIEEVLRGESHVALTTSEVPQRKGLSTELLQEAAFRTYVGKTHPLYAFAKAGKIIPVSEVLQHPFVSPSSPLLGKVEARQSLDGWRDDKFPRRVDYLTSSLKLLEELVVGGRALAYLPAYFGESLALKALKISGCPYSCQQKIQMVTEDPSKLLWMKSLR